MSTFAICPLNFALCWLQDFVLERTPNNCSNELEIEAATWPFYAPRAIESIGKERRSYMGWVTDHQRDRCGGRAEVMSGPRGLALPNSKGHWKASSA